MNLQFIVWRYCVCACFVAVAMAAVKHPVC